MIARFLLRLAIALNGGDCPCAKCTAIRRPPAVPLEAGRRYRLTIYAQATVEESWPPPVSHARQNSERAERQVIEGTMQQWFTYGEGSPRNAAVLLERPGTGKLAIFAETDVLEYEELG